ncbi:hypothetical protein [Membranihabitans marinus]|uniref:hypothetical protein n=1 Tax=Membranihabitans marinus TaxID=1227546 RepID=UPI001F43C092|nr:hypothetical protein [Membranihabitans marinus]
MIYDIIILCVTLMAILVAWYLKISFDWISFVLALASCVLVYYVSPYVVDFAEHSTTDFSQEYWYFFLVLVILVLFLAGWLMLKSKLGSQIILNRILGSLIFGTMIWLACGLLLFTLYQYKIVPEQDSQILSWFFHWRTIV